MLRAFAIAATVTLGTACIAPVSPAQRLSDAAIEMNTAMRFGRMDIANDYVSAGHSGTFAQTHSQWGKRIRIVDVEFSGVKVVERDEADVNVAIVWQYVDDPMMRETKVIQHWKDNRGSWTVTKERTEGDTGLLGPEGARPRLPSVLPPAPIRSSGSATADAPPPPLPVEVATPHGTTKPSAARFQTRVISSEE